jgi:hypothetical protein
MQMVTDYEQALGRLILRCDTEEFERLRELICRESGAFVPITVPPTPLRLVLMELAADEKPRPVGLVRNLVAMLLCLFLVVLGPIGLITVVRWVLAL